MDDSRLAEPLDVLFLQTGEIDNFARKWSAFGALPDDFPPAKQYWFVFRFNRQQVPDLQVVPMLQKAFAETRETARQRHIEVAGIQLDIDSPTRALPQYAVFLREVKKGLAREDRYEEAAALFAEIHANIRAPRMRQLAALYRDATTAEGKLKFAQFLSANPDRIYFNDAVWSGFQRYALFADQDSRFTAEERKVHIDLERKLKDDQEERWRAYLILRDIVKQEGKSPLGRQAAQLGIQCLTHISERFGRHKEIRQAEMELYRIR